MRKLDLHGYKVHDAWKEFNNYVESSYDKGFKKLTVILGHGKMSAEIDGWVTANPLTMSVHQGTPNTGEFTVKLKKNKPTVSKPKESNKPSRLATEADIAQLVAKWNA
jgi:DNA-nicking Smr family endonuclease